MLVAAYSAGPLAGKGALGYLVQKAGYMTLLEYRGLCSNNMCVSALQTEHSVHRPAYEPGLQWQGPRGATKGRWL